MAINASTNWYVRVSGNVLNGGGWDPAISGAGVNYADQDSPQLSLTDLATPSASSTTLTSATGGFTSAMIGNCIRIASGTNFTAGYYFITARTDANTVTLDRTPSSAGAGASGVGRVGGAFAGIDSLHNGGNASNPTITTPLAAGHQVNIRGSGSDNPSSADYTYTNYYAFPGGNFSSGFIRFVGYNGRPRFAANGLLFYQPSYTILENMYFVFTGNGFPVEGVISGGTHTHLLNVWIDQNGVDRSGAIAIASARFCRFFNSGITTQGSSGTSALQLAASSYGAVTAFNDINGWRGNGISAVNCICCVTNNVIRNNKRSGYIASGGDALRGSSVIGNSIYGNTEDGIRLSDANTLSQHFIRDNVIENNGAYGINLQVGTTALNDRCIWKNMDRNFFYNNTSGSQVNKSAGANDVTLTGSAFTNAASGDFSLNNNSGGGASVRASQIVFPSAVGTSYIDGGAIQAIASTGGGLLLPRPMNGGYSA